MVADAHNLGYVRELFERYLGDADSVPAEWRAYFASNGNELAAARAETVQPASDASRSIASAIALIEAHRRHGHLAARLDPLGSQPIGDPALDPAQLSPPLPESELARISADVLSVGPPGETLADVLPRLRDAYCGTIAYEIEHIASREQRNWLRLRIESGSHRRPLDALAKRALLERLVRAETFEQYLRKVFPGQKSFSLEGLDSLVPLLDELAGQAAANGTAALKLGMAHRGRLNVLAHLVGVSYGELLREFEGERALAAVAQTNLAKDGMGDVKYHLGANGCLKTPHGPIEIRLAANPSHLEAVNAVVEGMTRARQSAHTRAGEPVRDERQALAVLIHGDAAFPGQGSVAEVLNLQQLSGYTTGGAIHLIANNQVGFTTDPSDSRSTRHASDLAKGFDCPIVHVNADDPEAVLAAARLALAFRERFRRDVVIDLIGYRRLGHNETDEPAYTQPRSSVQIATHPTVVASYGNTLISEGVLDENEYVALRAAVDVELRAAHEALRAELAASEEPNRNDDEKVSSIATAPTPATAVSPFLLRRLNEDLLHAPPGFTLHPKLAKQLARRSQAIEQGGIDYGQAEALAFASLLADGVPIRLTGQDVERGTFSQRHLVLHDAETGAPHAPIQHLPQARSSFEVRNSPLSEYAALGFEYGYAVATPEALVLWEAQFGDFVNGAQIVIDQFIASGFSKWGESSRLTLLLPHGYEGNGPEHSSARIERFLQLAAENNLRIANPTTSAQYFHLLRRQALDDVPRPLVVFTPKGLLRAPVASSTLHELATGSFQPLLGDPEAAAPFASSVIACSGRVYYDLVERRREQGYDDVPIVRVEQLYPFPLDELQETLAGYPSLVELVWVQEEPQNMGPGHSIRHQLEAALPPGVELRYAGRPRRASPSEGYSTLHAREQVRLLDAAFSRAGQRRLASCAEAAA